MGDSVMSNAMLILMRNGAPNADILLAKTIEDLVAIGERHGVQIPLSIGPSAAAQQTENVDASKGGEYDVRRFTAPPSAFESSGPGTSAALSRARIRRHQRSEELLATPTGATSDGNAQPPPRIAPATW